MEGGHLRRPTTGRRGQMRGDGGRNGSYWRSRESRRERRSRSRGHCDEWMVFLVHGERMIPAVLDPSCYPSLEGFLRDYASARRVFIHEHDSKSDLELDLGTERTERNVLRDLEAPDVVGRGDGNFDDNLPVDWVPAMEVGRSFRWTSGRGCGKIARLRWIVLFALCERTIGWCVGHAPETIPESVGSVGENRARLG